MEFVCWLYLQGIFARNFYTFKLVALALAFAINIMLLFFKVRGFITNSLSLVNSAYRPSGVAGSNTSLPGWG